MSFPWTINISKNCRANQGSKIGNIQGSDISDFWGRRVCQGGRGRQTILGRPPPIFAPLGLIDVVHELDVVLNILGSRRLIYFLHLWSKNPRLQ